MNAIWRNLLLFLLRSAALTPRRWRDNYFTRNKFEQGDHISRQSEFFFFLVTTHTDGLRDELRG